jgi:hypothetical protein
MARWFACFFCMLALLSAPVMGQVTSEPTVVAMQELTMPSGNYSVQGYYSFGDGGAGLWTYSASGCTVSWCVASMGSTGSFTFTGGTIIDPRALGAREDVGEAQGTVTVTLTPTCSVVVTALTTELA